MKKQIAIFGHSGGLGSQITDFFKKENNFEIHRLDSQNLDISKREAVERFFSDQDIDIVLNLAVYNFDSFIHKYSMDKDTEIEKQLNVNIKGSVNILASCLPKMRENNFGRIIFASSIAADNPILGTSIYSASKSFIESIMKTTCLENASYGITANAVQLGYFDGGLLYKIDEQTREKIKNRIPMKRWGTIQELFDTIMYLINTPYVNGSALKITGGL